MQRAHGRRRDEGGSAIADFVLVSVVLVPVFFAVLQLFLIWHVRTTLTSAASEGARYGAAFNRQADDGAQRTSQVIDETFGPDFDEQVTAEESARSGQQIIEVEVTAEVPVLAFWGPTVSLTVRGHAVKEILP